MTRSKQTARKSTGGKAPRRERTAPFKTFHDHAGMPYLVVGGQIRSCVNQNVIRKLGVHLYRLSEPSQNEDEDPVTTAQALGEGLLHSNAISGWGNARNWWPRADVYSPLPSIDACIAHHRAEKLFRKSVAREAWNKGMAVAAEAVMGTIVEGEGQVEQNARKEVELEQLSLRLRTAEPLPHIVPSWCCAARFWHEHDYRHRYRSFILVALGGCRKWDDVLQHGLWFACFDQDVSPAMETEMDDIFSDEAKDGWVEVRKVDRGPSTRVELVCVRDQGEEITPGCTTRLFNVWADMTAALHDCTYRIPSCDTCFQDVPHRDCAIELDEHFFDDDGQCVACRRAFEYRRHSKRIATRATVDTSKMAAARKRRRTMSGAR